MNKIIIQNDFIQIVDYYTSNFDLFSLGKVGFDCEHGSIEFVKIKNTDKIIVHEIYVREQYRKNGLCREFIKYLIDKSKNKKVIIQSVLSKILYEFLLRFEYNNGKFIVSKNGFVFVVANKN